MIWVRLAGGLGNQLFQIAAGLTVRSQTNEPLALVINDLGGYETKRPFYLKDLEDFKALVSANTPWWMSLLGRYRLTKFLKGSLPAIVVESNISNTKKKGRYWVDDYFQRTELVSAGLDELRMMLKKERDKRTSILEIYSDLCKGYSNSEVVAIHVRKGDYLSEKNKKIFFELDGSYYERALQNAVTPIRKIVVFETTGGIHMSFGNKYDMVSTKKHALSDVDEFFLMSCFKNIIIANSTFSFWAALIGKEEKGMIVGPQNWTYVQDHNYEWNKNLTLNNFTLV